MARQISDQSAAMMIFLRPVFFTASTTRVSSQVLMKVRSIGFCSGNTSCSGLMSLPPRSSRTVVRMVGTLKTLAVLASDDVVHDHRRFVAVQIGELEGLVIDQDQDRLLWGQQGIQAVLEDWGLGHGVHSGLG